LTPHGYQGSTKWLFFYYISDKIAIILVNIDEKKDKKLLWILRYIALYATKIAKSEANDDGLDYPRPPD
jgi:hypothetical protein